MLHLSSGLRTRLVALFLIVPLSAVAIIVYTTVETRDRDSRSIETNARNLLLLISANQEKFIAGARQLLTVLADAPEIRAGSESCSALLNSLLSQNPDYGNFVVYDPTGNPACAVPSLPKLINVYKEIWFQQVRSTLAFAVSDYQVDQSSGEPLLLLAYPLRDADGRFAGAISVSVKLSTLDKISVSELSLPEGAVVVLFDRQATVLIYEPAPGTWVGQSARNALLAQSVLAQGRGVGEMTGLDGVSRLFAFAPIGETTGFYLTVGISRQIALAQSDQWLVRNLILLGLVSALTLAVAWWGSSLLIVRPIQTLVAATEKLRQGNLSIRAGSSGGGEIAQLSEAFNTMAAELEEQEVERKQSESALRESEERFRAMADNTPALIWVAEADGLRTFFNKPWLDFTGRTLRQEQGTGWADGLFDGDYQRYLDAYVVALKNRQSFELEYRLRRADGVYRWMVDSGVPSFTPDHQFAGFTGISLDITERHAAGVALRLSRDQFAIILQGAADGITAHDSTGRLHFANDAAARIFGFLTAEGLLATSWPDVLRKFELFDEAGQAFPFDDLPSQLALLGISKSSATIRLRPAAGGDERWLNIKATPILNERDQAQLAISIFQDITELKQAGVAQRLLAEAGRLLVTPLDNAARLADLTQLAIPLLADWCAMDVVNTSGSLLRAAVAGTASVMAVLPQAHPFELEAPNGVRQVVQTGESIVYPFIPDSLLQAAARDEAHLQALRALDLKSAMIVPLIARDRPIGAFTFVWAETQRRYGRTDLALAEELGRQVALALENVRLYDEAQQLNATLEQRVNIRTMQLQATNTKLENQITERQEVQRRLEESQSHLRRLSGHLQAAREEERLRIAREIHDELGQALAGLKMDVAWLQSNPAQPAGSISQKLEDMSVLIDATVKAVRRISTELRPSILDDLGLEAALEWQLAEFTERTGLGWTLESDLKTVELDSDRATALFRICQEALTNVARHANATRVHVRLEETADWLTLRIQDNGQGINEADRQKSKSFGLLGMQERVNLLEGTLDIQGRPHDGTTVTVEIPLKKERSHD